MAVGETPDSDVSLAPFGRKQAKGRHNLIVSLNDEQIAAAEGWRSAHGIADQSEALGELIRLGLLSEIAKIYRLVCNPNAVGTGQTAGSMQISRRKAGPKHQPG